MTPEDHRRDLSLIERVASNLEMERDVVSAVASELLLQLHKRALEYEGLNGDFIGEELWDQLPDQGYYHLLGFLEYLATRYSWDQGTAGEYLRRLGGPLQYAAFRHQMDGWHIARVARSDDSAE